jgi:cyclopropane fatty-acyl-phospholipid synthase-like methyltransferase
MAHESLKPEDFYSTYEKFREYTSPKIGKTQQRYFSKNYWEPCGFNTSMSVLEIGCGTGQFLKFFHQQGITDLLGIDTDTKILEFLPNELKSHVEIIDVNEFLLSLPEAERFDRIVMIDVFEHFSPSEGVSLLSRIKPLLKINGGVVVRVPNLASPWALTAQYGDLTHKAGYTSGSLRQLGLKAGYECLVTEYRRGNQRKQKIENLFHSFVELFITEPPDCWSASIVGFFQPEPSE